MPRLSKIGAAALAAFGWTGGASVSASYLVVAGGGGASGSSAGGGAGGGAGGFRTGTESLNPTLSYTVTVGAGGAAPSPTFGTAVSGNDGSNSVFSTITSTGGGGGGASGTNVAGRTGGSGGGGGYGSGAGGAGNTPSTSPSQGNNGGASTGGAGGGGGGGGGATATGGNGAAQTGGNGGNGTASSISGSSVTYGGGGGGAGNLTQGTGGTGGGGAGGTSTPGLAGTAGTANTGGGGGAGYSDTASAGGGSGIVIISYVGAQQFSGGVVTSVGGNTIHTFTTSGTLGPITTLSASYLIVAGGAGAGRTANGSGGGGAGGLLSGSALTIDPNSTYLVTVGAGGAGSTSASVAGTSGGTSSFSMVSTSAVGGGGGGSGSVSSTFASPSTGGSGGGGTGSASGAGASGAAGTSGQGNTGGTGAINAGGGGGGSGAVGGNATASTSGGNGGAGTASSISGTSTYYAGGGGGGTNSSLPTGTGGSGGGGNGGASNDTAGSDGTANTGGGGGGGRGSGANQNGGAGGSGVVIIAYPGSTQQMAGGTVTISGGNVIHTFTSSGYLTPIELVGRSLRFRSSVNAYLNRTPATAGNRKTWTWSGWVKRGTLSVNTQYLLGTPLSGATGFRFNSSDTFYFTGNSSAQFDFNTTQVFRDPSAWYHIVIAFDTTQVTSSNRVKFYVNGAQITAFGTATYPSQNLDGQINAVDVHRMSYINNDASTNFDGYMTEVNFVDGQALTPSSFGTVNSFGVWQPITYGGSYGTNGFYLTFGDNTSTTTLGYDTSPQGNNWTTNNISVTAGATYDSMLDVPTLTSATVANYCVLNPLNNTIGGNYPTMSNGNLSAAGAGNPTHIWGTIAIDAGNTTSWYWEAVCTSLDSVRTYMGIIDPAANTSAVSASYAFVNKAILSRNGDYFNTASGTAGGSAGTYTSYAVNDVVMVAYSNGKIWFGKNGTWMNSGNPAASTGAIDTAVSTSLQWVPYFGYNSNWTANFGQQPFTYTPPSGFVALNTFNLSTPTIPNGAVYMAATTYTGTGASLTVANTVNGTNFQPDWVWVKGRSGATDHAWYDVVRGTTKQLESNTTTVETTEATGLTAFGSTGFTVGALAQMNTSAATYVAWQWAANGAGVSNTSGSITSTVSANTTAGFAVVTYTGTGANATVGHGLGAVPSMIIFKSRTQASVDGPVYHISTGNDGGCNLNETAAKTTSSTRFNNTTPTSTVFSVGSAAQTNGSTQSMLAYVFAAIAGYSAFGSYTGNASTDGPFVFLGFRPRFVMIKRSDSGTNNWETRDTARDTYNTVDDRLFPNTSGAEDANNEGVDFLSNGFKIRNAGSGSNASGATYIYMAFAENPFKYANAR